MSDDEIKLLLPKDEPKIPRAIELVSRFDIDSEDGRYVTTDPITREERSFSTKKALAEFIKRHPKGGTVSKGASKKMFEYLDSEQ